MSSTPESGVSFWEVPPVTGKIPGVLFLLLCLAVLYLSDVFTWPLALGVCVVVIGVTALIARPVRVGIDNEYVWRRRGREVDRISLDEIRSVTLGWAPKVSEWLIIKGDTSIIEVRRIDKDSEEFRRRLGECLVEASSEVLIASKVRRVLLID